MRNPIKYIVDADIRGSFDNVDYGWMLRYADDFVIYVQHKHKAEHILQGLRRRLEKFGLELPGQKRKIVGSVGLLWKMQRSRDSEPRHLTFLGLPTLVIRQEKVILRLAEPRIGKGFEPR